ncbi:MAG: galactokinase [Anaerolineaceae bacterium]|jgi:galactokinase
MPSIIQTDLSRPASFSVCSPGRVNLLGEHVDYNEGVVLPVAVNWAVNLTVKPLIIPIVRLFASDLDAKCEFSLQELEQKQDLNKQPLPSYALYPASVAWSLQQAGLEVKGLEVTYTSDIPAGAGLSSSAAIQVAFALAWQHLGGWEMPKMELAKICQRAENEFVGVQSGLMDQFACLFGEAEHVLRFDTRSLEWSAINLPENTSIVIADSGVRRSLTDSAYNERRKECESAVRKLKQYLPQINSLRDVSPTQLRANLHHLAPIIGMRVLHVVGEMERVSQGTEALERQDIEKFGELMSASHNSLKDLYQVSVPELNALVDVANAIPGCFGARLTGAGFGGCTVNLVDSRWTDKFIALLQSGYQQRMGKEAQVYACQAALGAHIC